MKTDTELLSWLEEHMDEVYAFRNINKSKTARTTIFQLNYCSSVSGCLVQIEEPTLRGAISQAMQDDSL